MHGDTGKPTDEEIAGLKVELARVGKERCCWQTRNSLRTCKVSHNLGDTKAPTHPTFSVRCAEQRSYVLCKKPCTRRQGFPFIGQASISYFFTVAQPALATRQRHAGSNRNQRRGKRQQSEVTTTQW